MGSGGCVWLECGIVFLRRFRFASWLRIRTEKPDPCQKPEPDERPAALPASSSMQSSSGPLPLQSLPSWHRLAAELGKSPVPCPARIRIRTFRLRLPVTTKVHKFNADFGKRCDNVGSMCQVLGHPEDTPCPVVVGHITRPRLSPHSCSLLLAVPPN